MFKDYIIPLRIPSLLGLSFNPDFLSRHCHNAATGSTPAIDLEKEKGMASSKGGGAETIKIFQISINRNPDSSEPELRHSSRLIDKSNTWKEQQRLQDTSVQKAAVKANKKKA